MRSSYLFSFILITLAILVGGSILMIIGGFVSNYRAEKRQAEYEEQQQEQQRIEALEEAAVQTAKDAYNNLFAPLRGNNYVSADKAVSMYFDSDDSTGTFVDRFVPEDLKATNPEDVRYLIKVVYRKEAEGSYVGTISATVYRRYYDAQIIDLWDRYLLAETSIVGSFIQGNNKDGGISAYPYDEEVTVWIPTGIEDGLIAKAIEQKNQAYHHSMVVLSEGSYRCNSNADKAVLCEYSSANGSSTFFCSTEFLPEGLIVDTAEEVRFVVELHATFNMVGTYFGIGVSHNAYQHKYTLKIMDLATGKVIAENQFIGGDAPNTYTGENKASAYLPIPRKSQPGLPAALLHPDHCASVTIPLEHSENVIHNPRF